MSENLIDILSHLNPDVDPETLMLYLQGKLSPEQLHDLEKVLIDEPFESDALEGLATISDQNSINAVVEQLRKDLRTKTALKNQRRKKRELKIDPWLIILVTIILLLAVISYIIIHRSAAGQ